MDAYWQSEFRERMLRFSRERPLGQHLIPVSIKIRTLGGCFCPGCNPHFYRAMRLEIEKARREGEEFEVQEHESGPEILVYLAVVGGVLNISAAMTNLITAIIKARSEGSNAGDKPFNGVELIVRGHSKGDDYFEESILRVNSSEDITAKLVRDALKRRAIVPHPKTPKRSKKKKA